MDKLIQINFLIFMHYDVCLQLAEHKDGHGCLWKESHVKY